MTNAFYHPTQEHLTRLNGDWNAAYSGGKDSSSLVTWVEWMRRAGWIDVAKPRLTSSDTTVEYACLTDINRDMMALLTSCGWTCTVVTPEIHEKLFNRILGIGNTPIHPGVRRMRWCTRATKIDPMDRGRKGRGDDSVTLTGLRLGESTMRDGKIKRRGCSAGGECGIPDPSDRTYSPILNWTTCKVVDWLSGNVGKEVRELMADVFAITERLVKIYEVRVSQEGFDFNEPDVKAARFGCIGCPAISATREAPRSVISRNGADSPLNELYDVWFEARMQQNRLWGARYGRQMGPIKIEVRKRLFDRVMDIQRRAGVVLVTEADEAFIRQCWENKVYPRGWEAADEDVEYPAMPLEVIMEADPEAA